MRRSARLRSVMSRSTRIVPRFDGIGAFERRHADRTPGSSARAACARRSRRRPPRGHARRTLRGAPARSVPRRSCPAVRRPNSRTTPTRRRSPSARGHSATSRARHRSCCSARRRGSRARSSWTRAPAACCSSERSMAATSGTPLTGPARSARPGRSAAHWPSAAESARSMREIRLQRDQAGHERQGEAEARRISDQTLDQRSWPAAAAARPWPRATAG